MPSQHPMSLVYCFSCFATKEESGRKLYITNCQHVFCETCRQRDNFCSVCKHQCKSLEINDSLPNDIKQFFDPNSPLALIKTATKVIRFQHNLRLNAIKKHFGYHKKYFQLKKKLLQIREYKKKFDHEIERETKYTTILRNAYRSKQITPDLLLLGRKDNNSNSPKTTITPSPPTRNISANDSGMMSVSTKSSGIYSPLARFSMTNQNPRRTSLDDRISNMAMSPIQKARANRSFGSTSHNNRVNDENMYGDRSLLQDARNVLMINTVRCINESSQSQLMKKLSQNAGGSAPMKKMRF